MELDMYGFAKKEGEKQKELAYWRQHNALHGWMRSLYEERGGTEEFNCVELPLALEDLDRLEADVKNEALEPVSGFFFGSTDYAEEDWESCRINDLAFIEAAREHIARGYSVVYNSSW